jgi:proline iminopeptidase
VKTNILESVDINNSKQWIMTRGKDASAPLIIHVQAGPGLPIIPEADALNNLLKLEEDHLVAYWDQRGCGKSFDKDLDPATINLAQLTDDVIACTRYLLKKFNKQKATLVGYSIGATISLMAAAKNSELFNRLFLVGIDIDIPSANQHALEFMRKKAMATNNKKQLAQIARISTTPIHDTRTFQERAKLLTDLGGINTMTTYNQLVMSSVKNMVLSRAYRLGDILKTMQGMECSQDALLPEFDTLDLFKMVREVTLPAHFIQGRLDGIAPHDIAVKFFEDLKAGEKTFTTFEKSAHMPHYEEPAKFAKALRFNS